MQTEPVSLHSFCKDRNLPKSSVRRWLNDNGYSTSYGLSPQAVAAALEQFCPVVAAPATEPEATAITPEIMVGNHRGQLALPQQPAAIDLGAYRGENAALSSFEPEDIERFLDSCDGFLDAVNADFQHQQALTQRKEAAAAQVKAKVEQVKQAQMLYQVRSETLSLHNRAIDAELKEGLSLLGKPTAADGQPSQ
jgi:hypothetical protein